MSHVNLLVLVTNCMKVNSVILLVLIECHSLCLPNGDTITVPLFYVFARWKALNGHSYMATLPVTVILS